MSDRMKRYRAENRHPLESRVMLDGPGEAYPRVIATTSTLHDAEKIVRALNDSAGAVDLLDDLADVLAEVSRGELDREDNRVRHVLRRATDHVNGGR